MSDHALEVLLRWIDEHGWRLFFACWFVLTLQGAARGRGRQKDRF